MFGVGVGWPVNRKKILISINVKYSFERCNIAYRVTCLLSGENQGQTNVGPPGNPWQDKSPGYNRLICPIPLLIVLG